MDRDVVLLAVGAVAAIPFGLLTNFMFERLYKPGAKVEIGNLSGWRHSANYVLRSWRFICGKEPIEEICVCTDGSFIDTAVFFMAVIEASKSIRNATIRLKHDDWPRIPFAVSRDSNCIVYFNRSLLGEFVKPMEVWSNLCSYRGYALVGRPEMFPNGSPPDMRSLEEILEQFSSRKPLKILTMGATRYEFFKLL